MNIKISSLFLLLFFYQVALGKNLSDWIAVDAEGDYFINEIIFPRDRHLKKALELQNFNSSTVEGVNSMELLTEYDCKKRTFRLLTHRAYSDYDLKGELIYDWQSFDPRAFVGIPVQTPAEKIFKLVCGYLRKSSLKSEIS